VTRKVKKKRLATLENDLLERQKIAYKIMKHLEKEEKDIIDLKKTL
jgi:hypothetical protein